MSLPEAVRSVLTQYATFSGRARRSEFWWFVLAAAVGRVVAAALDVALGLADSMSAVGPVTIVLGLALLVPTLAVATRRLHDVGRPGWWCVFLFIPIVNIVMLIPLARDSGPANRYGPSAKAAPAFTQYAA